MRTTYYRFDTTAEALRYVIEEMPPELLPGVILETEEQRIGADQTAELSANDAYLLARA